MNIQGILRKVGIVLVEQHHSLSNKCVGINCPFCHNDTDYHLGIFLDSGNYSCWKCGSKGSLFTLLKAIKNISYKQYKELTGFEPKDISPHSLDSIFKKEKKIEIINEPIDFNNIKAFKEPNKLGDLPAKRLLTRFLTRRNLSIKILHTYGARIAISGKYLHRLIIPIPTPFDNDNVYGFTARDLTNQSSYRYINSEDFQIHDFLYKNKFFHQNSNNILILVEGIFDVWSIENYPTIGLFGKNISKKQFNEIVQLSERFDTLVVCLDGDAKRYSMKLCQEFSPFFQTVIPLYLPENEDPSSLGSEWMNKLIGEVLHE